MAKRVLKGFSWMSLFSGLIAWADAPEKICSGSSGLTDCNTDALYHNVGIAAFSGIQIVYIVCILMGIAGTIFGLLKLKQHAMDAQGSSGSLRQAIYSLIISSLLISVPVILMLTTGSLFGQTSPMIPMSDVNTIQNYGQGGTVATD